MNIHTIENNLEIRFLRKMLGISLFSVICFFYLNPAHSQDSRNIYVVYGGDEGAGPNERVLLSIPDGSNIPARNQSIATKFHALQEKGYRIIIINKVENEELARIVSDDSTAAVFQHGHGIIVEDGDSVYKAISSFEGGETSWLERDNLSQHTGQDFKPGKNLKYYVFTGCYGGECEINLRESFNLGKDVKYISLADDKSKTSDGIASSIRGGAFDVVINDLPDHFSNKMMPTIKKAKNDANSVFDILEWVNDVNEETREEIFSIVNKHLKDGKISAEDLLRLKDPDKITGFIRALDSEIFTTLPSRTKKNILGLISNENYFIRHYISSFITDVEFHS